ncbi:MAG: bifunctional [glutamine synthetase] adenylyltransferase/[glutamine synthetase]-adenylyl-L-tyrosine phosphorylase [Sphingomonadales bacterium]|nr:bifunctional [glutamine synthetase] adenylyltransferase/[glutamine synthetase]-adenylyl-L-tyrosine phosphorylase [Sphingomonadales bacterium]
MRNFVTIKASGMWWEEANLPQAYNVNQADNAAGELDAAPADAAPLIRTLAGNSPFLARSLLRDKDFAVRLVSETPDGLISDVLDGTEKAAIAAANATELMRVLRRSKAEIALLTAAADIASHWDLETATDALSRFAELVLSLTVDHLIHARMVADEIAWPKGEPEPLRRGIADDSGFVVIGMGKLGAHELNYSSDIDLIVLFDEEKRRYVGSGSAGDFFVKLTRELVRIIDQRTAGGYVFRTDLRLRPDPGATPVALSMAAAEYYYASVGLNWERAAMIKARPVAGDAAAGRDFLDRITGFVWRKNLDFAAIQDIHRIKTQIHTHHHHKGIGFAGHDVKLGRGGIREIEFFAQIHQLISGGRDRSIRSSRTLDALAAICDAGKITAEVQNDLSAAYRFLRRLEHRLQMIEDAQTHTLPTDPEALTHIAVFMGYDDATALEETLLGHLRIVAMHYDAVLPEVATPAGDETPPEVGSATLAELGFANPESAAEIINKWHVGRYRALRTERARRLISVCLPPLLKAFSQTREPDQALARFDSFVAKLPAGVQIFSLFEANRSLFGLVARIMGTAPALANRLARNISLFDAVLDPDFYEPLPNADALAEDAIAALAVSRDYQDALDAARRWLADRKFRLGVQILEGLIDVHDAGLALANLADAIIGALLPWVEADFSRRYGGFAGDGLAVLALGKYGGRELSFASDLDIVLLYDANPDCPHSSGPKQISASQYFSSFGQHLITAITAMTGEGRLFEVDMRLRPSGASGPLVVTLETFATYQKENAWTWEHMALTRARILFAVPEFAGRILGAVRDVIAREREEAALVVAVDDMRMRLDKEFGTANPFSVKFVRGGIVDIEFICQYLILREAHNAPELIGPFLPKSIRKLADIGALSADEVDQLHKGYELMQTTQGLVRLTMGTRIGDAGFPADLKSILARATGRKRFEALESNLIEGQKNVLAIYRRLISDPAQVVRKEVE